MTAMQQMDDTEKSNHLPPRTLSRKSSMGLDKTKGYDFSFSEKQKEFDPEAPIRDKYENLQKYMLSNGGRWSRLFHCFWLMSFALTICGVIVATLVVPTRFVVCDHL